MTTYTGFSNETAEKLILDAGVFFKNFNTDTMTGTLLGATQGGGEFSAVPTVRSISVDGVPGRGKGLQRIDSWEISIMANLLELSSDTFKMALIADVDSTTNADYDIITGKHDIGLSDYIDNVTWVGRLSGSRKPVIIQIFNALTSEGITFSPTDRGEGVVPIRFFAHFDPATLEIPYKIFYPKLTNSVDTTPPTVTANVTDGQTNVAKDTEIVWNFNEPIKPSFVTSEFFNVLDVLEGELIEGSLTLSPLRNAVTFTPNALLGVARDYTATVKAGVQDLAGNALAADSILTFTSAV